MKLSWVSDEHCPASTLSFSSDGKNEVKIVAEPWKTSPSLALWRKWQELGALSGDTLTVKGPAGASTSFHFWMAAHIAHALVILFQDSETEKRINVPEQPLAKHLLRVQTADQPDQNLFGHSLAQLASYAQAEWAGAYMPCPLEGRIRSIFLAILRSCNNQQLLFPDPAQEPQNAAGNVTPSGRLSLLFDYSLRASSVNNYKDEAIAKTTLNLPCPNFPKTLLSPRIEGILDSFDLNDEGWLKSLVERLKRDRDAYKRDAVRAKRDYSALIGSDGRVVPVETFRIDAPESLLFDLWAHRDAESSLEHKGFPILWIDNPWLTPGFDLLLDSSSKQSLKSLSEQWPATASESDGKIMDAGWSLRFPGDPEHRSNVRYHLKRRFFPEGADFTGKFITVAPRSKNPQDKPLEWTGSPSLLEAAILDSEPGKKEKIIAGEFSSHKLGSESYLWAEVEFAEINVYESWAGDEIAAILYSLLRPAADMTLPNDFQKNHIHRAPGIVCAWAAEGMVVAYGCKGKAAVEKLKEMFVKAAQLEGDIEDLIRLSSNPLSSKQQDSVRKDRVRNAITEQMKMRQETANPELRPLRRFLERHHAQDVYDAFRQSEADENQVKMLEEMNQSSDRLDWLEAVLFAFAITEAGHILGEALRPHDWVLITVLASILGGCAAILFLSLTKYEWFRQRHSERIGKTVLFLVFIGLYGGALYLSCHDKGGVKEPPLPAAPCCTAPISPGTPPAATLPAPAPRVATPASLQTPPRAARKAIKPAPQKPASPSSPKAGQP